MLWLPSRGRILNTSSPSWHQKCVWETGLCNESNQPFVVYVGQTCSLRLQWLPRVARLSQLLLPKISFLWWKTESWILHTQSLPSPTQLGPLLRLSPTGAFASCESRLLHGFSPSSLPPPFRSQKPFFISTYHCKQGFGNEREIKGFWRSLGGIFVCKGC